MKIKEILQIVESYAPSALQAEYDNSGLQIGFPEDEVRGVLLCVDVTPQVIEEAALKGANLVISHHPVLFNAVKCIRAGEFTSDILLKAAAARVSVYSAHTNLDCALGGLNDYLAGALGVDVDIELAGEGEFYRMGTVHGGMTFSQFRRQHRARHRRAGAHDRQRREDNRHGGGEHGRGRRRQGNVRKGKSRGRGRGRDRRGQA